MPIKSLSHLDKEGQTKMVDVGQKPVTHREAVAIGRISLHPDTLALLKSKKIPKGNVLDVSRVAGILAAKRVDELIPLSHSLKLDSIDIRFLIHETDIEIRSTVKTQGKTGVEMEALTAASMAALTIYDMCKAVDKEMVIGPVYLQKKSGGRGGLYLRDKKGKRPWE